jgi:hypothetical protein
MRTVTERFLTGGTVVVDLVVVVVVVLVEEEEEEEGGELLNCPRYALGCHIFYYRFQAENEAVLLL